MKHLKIYEEWNQDEEVIKLHNIAKTFKKGDYVIINCEDYYHSDPDNEIMILDDDAKLTSDGFTVSAYKIGQPNTALTFYDYEVVGKATDEEIAVIKYNL